MAKAASNNQVVYPHDEGWAVRKEGSDRATGVYATRHEAMERARELAQSQNGEVYYFYTGWEYGTVEPAVKKTRDLQAMLEDNQVVYPHEKGWAVRKEGSDRATATYDTRDEAMNRAFKIAENQNSDVFYFYTGEEPEDINPIR